MTQVLRGVFPIVNTTFHEDGSLDLQSQIRLVNHLLDAGAHGLGLFGNASEGYALTEDERRTLLRTIAREVDGRVPLVVSSGHSGTSAAAELSRQAEDAGAQCLMILPPSFMKTDGDGLVHYYDTISRAVNIPIMIQDAPLMTQVPMPAALLARMAREIEHARYVKVEAPPTAPKISELRRVAGDSLVLFGGLNCQFFIEEYQRGAQGQMPGSDATHELVAIWNCLEAGDTHRAWMIFTQILPLLRFELQPGLGVSAMKHNLVADGVIASARVRHPTASLKPESVEELAFLRQYVRTAEPVTPRR